MSKIKKKTHSPHKKAIRVFIKRCFNQEPIRGPVLEIGSGKDQFNRKLFSKRYKVITSNIYPENVVDHICSVNCLPFEDGKFGCVICEHVLEHVEDPVKAIEEIRRVLKSKGLLILVVPFSWPIHQEPFDLWRFTEEGLRFLLMKSFDHVKFEAIGKPNKPNLIFATARKPLPKKRESKRPKASVIMPTYNRAHIISKSIDSVLNQTLKDWELIVVSDGSTDNTREAVEKYKDQRIVFLEKKENTGSASARNYGLKHARGKYIAYCDDDDELFPYHLQTLVNYLEAHPEKGWVRGRAVRFHLGDKRGYRYHGFLWALMHKRSALKKVGYFDKTLRMSQDLDFVIRFCHYYGSSSLECIVAKHNVHPGSIIVVREAQHRRYEDHVYVKSVRKIPKKFRSQKLKESLFILAIYRFGSNGFVKAALSLAKIFYSYYPGITSLYLLGLSYYRAGNISKAIECMEKVVSYTTKPYKKESRQNRKLNEFVYALLGRLYLRKREYNLSLRHFYRGLDFNPRSHLLKLELFHAYLERGRKDLAQQILKNIRSRTVLSYMRGALSLYQKNYREAEENFKKALSIDESLCYRLYASLGKLYSKTGKKELAETCFIKSLEFERRIYFSLLNIASRKVDHQDMREFLEKVFLPGRFPAIQII